MNAADVLAVALAYADHGWPVFPLRGKTPARPRRDGGRGFHDASTDPEVVAAMWASYPGANIGIRTGEQSGLAVLDVDPPAGVETLTRIEAERDIAPGTLMQQTGSGGLHLLYRWQPGLGVGSAVWGTGLDLRGEGGYIVAPPSIHPDTGQPYAWTGDGTWRHELPAWPGHVLPVEKPAPEPRVVVPFGRPGGRQGILAGLVRVVIEAPTGERNTRLNWAAYRTGEHIHAGRLDQVQAVTALQLAAERVGLTASETRATIASGIAKGLAA